MRKVTQNKTGSIIKTVTGVVFIVAVLTVISLFVAQPSKNRFEGYPIGSTFSADPGGCELMLQLFRKLNFTCFQHRKLLLGNQMPGDSGKSIDVIWHNSAVEPLSDYEVEWVENWVSEGGTLVLVDNALRLMTAGQGTGSYGIQSEDKLIDDWLYKLDVSSGTKEITSLGGTVGPDTTPNRLVIGSRSDWGMGYINEVQTYKRRGIPNSLVYRFTVAADESKNLITKLKDGYGGVVIWAKHGEGQVWLVSDPFLFSNMLLQESDNSVLAASIALSSREGDSPRILFDEYHLGFTQSVTLADAARTPLGRAILYLCAIGVLAIAIAGARFGPIRKPKGAIGVSQRAFVNALASLWMGANAVPAAADALYRRYGSRKGIMRKGLDKELDAMRTSRRKVDDLLEVAKKLDI